MEKKFYIQLFAEDETETPTEETVENKETETENVEDNDNVDFEDGAKKEESPKKDTKSQEDTKKKNYESAQRRISERQKKQEEARKKELETEKRKSYVEGIKNSTNGVNKFTNKPIVDEDDVEEYELMLKLEKEGKDPIEDFHEAIKQRNREARQKALAEEQAKAKTEKDMDNDIEDFVNKYGSETANKLSTDTEFMSYANKYLGKFPLTEIYEDFLERKALIEAEADKRAMQKDARRMSSSGGLGKDTSTPSSITDLSPEEFHKVSMEIARRR